MSPVRNVLAAAALVGAVWTLSALLRPEPTPPPPRAFTTSSDCRACHAEIHDEWADSSHALAWEAAALTSAAAGPDGLRASEFDRHAPEPVLVTGVGARVLPRNARRAEGVDCLTCHLRPDGRIAAGRTVERAACRPVATPELRTPELCGTCHDRHGTLSQWRASHWPARGEDCLSCHGWRADGTVRDHGFPGGDDPDTLRSAVELRAEPVVSGWHVTVENVGAGHSFPTGDPDRAAELFWRPTGKSAWRPLERFRDSLPGETPRTRALGAHEARRSEIPLDDGVQAVEVALFYRRAAEWGRLGTPPDGARLVHSIRVGRSVEGDR